MKVPTLATLECTARQQSISKQMNIERRTLPFWKGTSSSSDALLSIRAAGAPRRLVAGKISQRMIVGHTWIHKVTHYNNSRFPFNFVDVASFFASDACSLPPLDELLASHAPS
jgi:hypothetical protein